MWSILRSTRRIVSCPRLAAPFCLLLMLAFGAVVSAQEADPHSTTADFTIPLQDITQVKAGGIHTCALSTDGDVTCWGYNEQGQIGNGATITSSLPAQVSGLTEGIQFLAPGMFHTCVANTENVYCWGLDDHGQLGNGDKGDSLIPMKVMGLNGEIHDIDSGQSHSCVLTSVGSVQCWGRNISGQVGDGTRHDRTSPVAVVGLSSPVVSLTAGESHTCALLRNGEVMCWGWNGDGQIGDGTAETRTAPVPVVGLNAKAVTISAAGYHTCALLDTGQIQCWGNNYYGELGDGSTTDRLTPVTVQGLEGTVSAITTGAFHSCALMTAGSTVCWGRNRSGQLGDDTTDNRPTPTKVVGLAEPIRGITGGDTFTCGTIHAGNVKCWGGNFFGELGDHTTVNHSTPVDVLIQVVLEQAAFLPTIFK